MESSTPPSFAARLGVALDRLAAARLVPLHDHAVYHALACEMVRMISESDAPASVLCLDAHTAVQLDKDAGVAGAAARIVVFGEADRLPVGWPGTDLLPLDPRTTADDHFLVLLGPSTSIVLYGTEAAGAIEPEATIRGVWTTDRPTVATLAKALLGNALPASHGQAANDPGTTDANLGLTLSITSLHIGAVCARKRHIARDKDELFSVLGILKAISAKRCAHDVLYVFVEQIARIVDTRRCSVVRIWGGDPVGHVLASHEDESLQQISIDLAKYPELEEAMKTGAPVNIAGVTEHPLTAPFADTLQEAGISALLVIPIVLFDPDVGSLFLRAARGRGGFSRREVSFFEIVAEAASSALERAQLFENIQRANEQLAQLARTDGLTGLYNYRYFQSRLDEEYVRACRYRLPLSCILFDVDDFKKINDTHGHVAGDAVLRELAGRTLGQIRTIDFVARYGGEEFAVIMPQTSLKGATVEAERLCEKVGGEPFDIGGEHIRVTVSIGVATLTEGMNAGDALVHAADEALYKAKGAGKNRVVAHPLSGAAGTAATKTRNNS